MANIKTPNPKCSECHGTGRHWWPSTTCGWGGIGGSALTEGPCECTGHYDDKPERIDPNGPEAQASLNRILKELGYE